ncbi:MAG: DNA repair protein RadA [Chlamydiota bacterium]
MSKQTVKWACSACGHVQSKWSGSCLGCSAWNTFEEMLDIKASKQRFTTRADLAKPILIQDVSLLGFDRIATGYHEVDRLMGGGVVCGSLTLVGGQPGIGKSTLMLQLASSFAKQGLMVLYVCGEESAEQTSLRAHRLGIHADKVYLLNETLFSNIKAQVEVLKPDILIVDSVQIVYKDDLPSAPGSVVQVKEIAMECMHLAKGSKVTTFLIGHVTKSGDLAGPRILEHIVDTVLDFEGDCQHGYRLLRSSKNRFGPTEEIVVFQMDSMGLKEVKNPSLVFLEERRKESPGSVVMATLEGSRALLVEVQALITRSFYPNPIRRSTGVDQNRLALLLAVLEKKMKYPLYSQDVFVSVIGGMKVVEPGIDLGILLAIASSYQSKALSGKTVALGEVGLNGEVRSVLRIESRIKEAIHMGFVNCILPKHNMKGLQQEFKDKIKLCPVGNVEEAMEQLLGASC